MGRKRKHNETCITSSTSDNVSSTGSSNTTADSSSASQVECVNSEDCALQQQQQQPPVQRNAANERERARMRVLSRAFTRLKTSLPWVPADTKLSKLDTLRLASCYIAHLSRLLKTESDNDDNDDNDNNDGNNGDGRGAPRLIVKEERELITELRTSSGNVHPLNLTWPFTFSSRNGTTVAHFHRSGAPHASSGDVRGTSSTSLVTSSFNGGRLKMRVQSSMMLSSTGQSQAVR